MASIRSEDAAEWVRLRDQIKHLEALNIPRVKAEEERKRSQKDQECQRLRATIGQLQRQKAKEEKDVAKIEKKGVHRFAARIGGHLDEKVEKEKEEAAKAAADLGRATAALAASEKELSRISAGLARVVADEAALKGLQEQQRLLVERVFQGPNGAGDQYEKNLQLEVVTIRPDFDASAQRARDTAQASQHMAEGTKLCGNSLRFMGEAMRLCKADLVMDIGRRNGGMVGTMANIQKQRVLHESAAFLQASAREVSTARMFLPEIQPIDPNLVQVMGGMMDIVFDNVFTDMAIMKQVETSAKRIEATYVHLQQGNAWVQNVKRTADERYYAVKANYDAKDHELKAHRWRLMETAAGAGSASGFNYTPSAPAPPPRGLSGYQASAAPSGTPLGYPAAPTEYKAPVVPPPPQHPLNARSFKRTNSR